MIARDVLPDVCNACGVIIGHTKSQALSEAFHCNMRLAHKQPVLIVPRSTDSNRGKQPTEPKLIAFTNFFPNFPLCRTMSGSPERESLQLEGEPASQPEADNCEGGKLIESQDILQGPSLPPLAPAQQQQQGGSDPAINAMQWPSGVNWADLQGVQFQSPSFPFMPDLSMPGCPHMLPMLSTHGLNAFSALSLPIAPGLQQQALGLDLLPEHAKPPKPYKRGNQHMTTPQVRKIEHASSTANRRGPM